MSIASNKRILKNTLMLYGRMLLIMGVSLYTSRVILEALGFSDYGLYNVIGGFVGLFSIVSGSLSGAISRFITFELGTGNDEKLKKIFGCSNLIQFCLCGIIILLCATLGVWFIAKKMVIPNDDLVSAFWVFGFSVASFCINLLSVPYNAAIIAHEKMAAFSYMSIIEVVLKLSVAYSINLFKTDRVIVYAIMLFCISAIIRLLYIIYCKRHFKECEVGICFEKKIFKDISSFAGWNFIGASSGILKTQGTNVVINLFFGTVVNAAFGIANQASSAVQQLGNNFMTAVTPQITKLYASGDRDEMFKLMFRSSKISVALCWLLALIIIINTPYILHLWLDKTPEYTSTLVQLVLLNMVSEGFAPPLVTAALATGKIRDYQIVVGGIILLNLPLSYIALRMGYAPPIVLIISLILSQCALMARIIMLRGQIGLNVRSYLIDVYFRCLLSILISGALSILIESILNRTTFFVFVIESFLTITFVIITMLYVGLNRNEREFVYKQVITIVNRIKTA